MDQQIIDDFHKLWRDRRINDNLTYMGVQTCKSPMDLWVYQEIVYDIQPGLIIECGTYRGGTTNYLASLMQQGTILSIDVDDHRPPKHNRIQYIVGDSVSSRVFAYVENYTKSYHHPILVILDSGHHKGHVLKEMEMYGELVSPGSYMIVEDSDLNGHPTGDQPYWPLGREGPHEAIEEFMQTHDEFEIDKSREKFLFTVCRDGFLKKK